DTCKCTESVVEETVKNDEKPEENDVQKDEEKDVQKHEEKDIPKNEEPKPENVSQSLQSTVKENEQSNQEYADLEAEEDETVEKLPENENKEEEESEEMLESDDDETLGGFITKETDEEIEATEFRRKDVLDMLDEPEEDIDETSSVTYSDDEKENEPATQRKSRPLQNLALFQKSRGVELSKLSAS